MPLTFGSFSVTLPGSNTIPTPSICAFSMPGNRYVKNASYTNSVLISLTANTALATTSDYDGFIVYKSTDSGVTYSDASGVVRNSFLYSETISTDGQYFFYVKLRTVIGTLSSASNIVVLNVGAYGDADDLGLHEIGTVANTHGIFPTVFDRSGKGNIFPNGLSPYQFEGFGLDEGSLSGSFGVGAFHIRSRETDVPLIRNNAPACASTGASASLTTITFEIQDQPYTTSGSGIDDTSLVVQLSVASQYGGSYLTIRSGTSQPFNGSTPNISCVSATGSNPVLDRTITITTPSGYIGPNDTVSYTTSVSDLDGNVATQTCSFTTVIVDTIPPVVSNHSPECGLGTTPTDDRRVLRDTSYSFRVTDDVGINLSTLQVYIGTSSSGPWTQILQNGSLLLLDYSFIITPTGATQVDVTFNRPSNDPYWDDDTTYCVKVDVDDTSANSASKVCCFKTAACLSVSNVIPLAINLLLVQFNIGAKDDVALRDPNNYILTPVSSSKAVTVKRVLPQGFKPSSDGRNPTERFSIGFPEFVILDTGQHESFEKYTLELSSGLKDRYNFAPCDGNTITFRARGTKMDQARGSNVDIALYQKDSIARRVLSGITYIDDEIGGIFSLDDWDFS